MTTKEQWDKFADESIPKLRELGYLKNNHTILLCSVFLIVGMTLSGVFFYGIEGNKFKSDVSVNQNVSLEPEINNQYDMPINTEIKNNFTIYNTIVCPCQ